MKNLKNQEKAMTLIALIIAIIILLILATISIQALTNTGLFESANKVKLETKRGQISETLGLKTMLEQSNNPGGTAEEIITATRNNVIQNKNELEKIGKDVNIEDISTEEDGEKVDVYFYVVVDKDVYKVDMSGSKFIGELGKLLPTIKIKNLTNTTNSITIEVKTSRNEGGKVEYYIKGEDEDKYELKETKTDDSEYTYGDLIQGKKYNIKVIAKAKNGQTAELTVDRTTEKLTGTISFSIPTWINGKASTTISSSTNYIIQYQVNGISGNWITGTYVTGITNGDVIYARLWDGVNLSVNYASQIILDKIGPEITINLNTTNTTTVGSVIATITQKDNQSGINIEKCKWIYNTVANEIGTNENSYTGTFTSATQNLILTSKTIGMYYLHVLSVDNAGNAKEMISKAIEIDLLLSATDISKNPKLYYGYTIENYTNINNTDVGNLKWQIFYTNNKNVYLISETYINYEDIPNASNTLNKPLQFSGYYPNGASLKNILSSYTGSDNIIDIRLKELNSSYFNKNFKSTSNNMKAVAYMQDLNAWKKFKDNSGMADYAIGGPTIEMLINSHNQKYNTKYEFSAVNNNGYFVRENNNLEYSDSYLSLQRDNLYCKEGSSGADAMWLSSPSAKGGMYLLYTYINYTVETWDNLEVDYIGFRPIVCLNSNITFLKNIDGKIKINK